VSMREHSDLLLTIAEISIAFAGFASVVAAFSRFRLEAEAAIFRVRLMVIVSLSTLLFALLPLLPPKFGASEAASWQISAMIIAVIIIALSLWAWRRLKPLYSIGLIHTQKITAVWYTCTAILIAGLIASAVGLLAELAPAIYLSTLFFGLVLCSFYFIMLIAAVSLRDD